MPIEDRHGIIRLMASPILPSEHAEKIEELREYLQKTKPDLSVRAGWEFDSRSASFPFDKGPILKHLLRVSARVLQDYTTSQIIEKLESAKWEEVLSQLPSNQMAVFDTAGFQSKPIKD